VSIRVYLWFHSVFAQGGYVPYPLIGLTGWQTRNEKGHPSTSVSMKYTQAVAEAGGIPLIIPLGLLEEQLERLAARLDGILFTGGGDVHPGRYGSAMHPLVSEIDEDRDRVEICLIREAARGEKPFFGICRGVQAINVALGGTLYEDILDQMPGGQPHQFSGQAPRNTLAHPVRVREGSRLAGILGSPETGVNSLHHQGLRLLAPGLAPVAWAPDGLVEAVELTGHPFGLGVQWHPEWLQEHAPMRALFRAFVEAAKVKRDA
jgi:putative glutamine amidotransferase